MVPKELPAETHQKEISENLQHWKKKPLLQLLYREFHEKIAAEFDPTVTGTVVELGSGIGNIKAVLPTALCTDIAPAPWIDQVENAYHLSFPDASVSHLILFDVFHHLRYPGTALKECSRVLKKNGRVILFEPYVSLLGRVTYGMLHHEPIALNDRIIWEASSGWNYETDPYYAAQGNATRIFFDSFAEYEERELSDWAVLTRERFSALSYVFSGGYSKPQLYPTSLLPFMKQIDRVTSQVPSIFAHRALIVLKKV